MRITRALAKELLPRKMAMEHTEEVRDTCPILGIPSRLAAVAHKQLLLVASTSFSNLFTTLIHAHRQCCCVFPTATVQMSECNRVLNLVEEFKTPITRRLGPLRSTTLGDIQPLLPHVSMVYIYCNENPTKETFSFTFSAGPSLNFSFDRQLPLSVPANRSFKRRRALSDVDGEGNEGRKKRRLRLNLITSRLSRPFSQPASNIVNRGTLKISIWGKQKPLNRNLLRKAAIMNAVRLQMDAAKAFMLQEQERGRETLALKEIVVQKPRTYEMPLPPSPLGLSNYDALDLEDEMLDEDGEEGREGRSPFYSDFSILNPSTDGDGYDYLDALDGISSDDLPATPPPPPLEDGIVEMLREKERLGDNFFVHVGG